MAIWVRNMRIPGRTRTPRILTNNPERGSSSWRGMRPGSMAQRTVRRLMKTDPSNAQGTPASQVMLSTPGMSGNGATRARIVGHSESRQTAAGTGVSRIRNRGANRTLKKR